MYIYIPSSPPLYAIPQTSSPLPPPGLLYHRMARDVTVVEQIDDHTDVIHIDLQVRCAHT